MTIKTLLQYLFGYREGIQGIATCRQALPLGAIFVFSAGFAREYDGEYLLAEPWYLLIPLVASLVTSFLLWWLVACIAPSRSLPEFPLWKTYRAFLGLYWMTAPLAWLYAIPYERWLSPADALRMNLWTLGAVALIRVVLMCRAVHVLTGMTIASSIAAVMLFADSIMLGLLFLTPLPVIEFMGGVRHTESESLLLETAFIVGGLGIVSFPVWSIGYIVALTKRGRTAETPLCLDTPGVPASSGMWLLGFVSLLIWIPILPITQPEQQRRWIVERDLNSGRIADALAFLSRHQPDDFPPSWEPPPYIAYRDVKPPLIDVLEQIIQRPPADWVHRVYADKLVAELGYRNERAYWCAFANSDRDFARYVNVMPMFDEARALLDDSREQIVGWAKDEDADSLSDDRRESLMRLADMLDSTASERSETSTVDHEPETRMEESGVESADISE